MRFGVLAGVFDAGMRASWLVRRIMVAVV